jgi:CelD/BcsL family acetyltransferase involved in cellulose biosynthesis
MTQPEQRYQVDIAGSWPAFAERLRRLACANHGSPFQSASWLDAWYAALGQRADVEPVLVGVRDSATGADALLLPLIRRRSGPVQSIEFADLWVTDYCEPCLGPAAPTDAASAQNLLDAIVRVLQPADILSIDKMPMHIGERINPLALCSNVAQSTYSGHWIDFSGGWDEYLRSLKKAVRTELGRSMRLLEAMGRVDITMADTAADGLTKLALLERLQQARFAAMGVKHPFGAAAHQQFYRELVKRGVASGNVVMSGISLDGHLVASALMIRSRDRFTLMRFGFEAGDFDRVGLGRLIVEQSMKLSHQRGCKLLDLSIGATDMKRRLGATTEVPLYELRQPLSWTGTTVVAYGEVRRRAAANPLLRNLKQRFSRPRAAGPAPGSTPP